MSKKQNTKQVCTDQVTSASESEAPATIAEELKELARQITELRELLEQVLDDLWAQSAQEDSQETSDAEW